MATRERAPRITPAEMTDRLADIENMFEPKSETQAHDPGDLTSFDPERVNGSSVLVEESVSRITRIKEGIAEQFEQGADNREALKDEARETLRAAGRSALEVGKKAIRVSVGVDMLIMEAAGKGVTYVKKRLTIIASEAKARFKKRVNDRRERKAEDRRQKRLAEETEAYDMHDQWTTNDTAEQALFEEAQARNQEVDEFNAERDQADAMDRAHDHDSAQEFHQERLSAEEELRAETERDAREARARKAVRKARNRANREARRRQSRQEWRELGEDLREVYVSKYARRIGRAARFVGRNVRRVGRAVKRGSKAVAAGASAAKASWDAQK